MANDLWETPQYIFDWLDEEFNFELDVAASQENTKCGLFWSKEFSALDRSWNLYNVKTGKHAENKCFMNPPYSNPLPWVKKAYEESQKGCTVVCLLPADISTKWFHEWVIGKAEIRLVRGRISFDGNKKGAPKFGSMIAIYGPRIEPKVISVKRPDKPRKEAVLNAERKNPCRRL